MKFVPPKPPVCCGKPAKPYMEKYGKPCHSTEMGFRCVVCKRSRLPYDLPGDAWLPFVPFTPEQQANYEENLRAEGLA